MAHATEYDVVTYTSRPFDNTAPANLAGIATLFGATPVDVQRARVLELGCAAGGNIIPHAVTYPDSSFLGIDLSTVQVEEGNEVIKELNLRNVELQAMSIEDLDSSFDKFDYIIAHGLFSWVPVPLQETLFNILQTHLSDHGIAYISANTHPGWQQANAVRDALLFQTDRFTDLTDKARVAREFLNELRVVTAEQNSAYSRLIQEEHDRVAELEDHYLIYDHLNPNNNPVYFSDFMRTATHYGLKYVADSELQIMFPENFPAEITERLESESDEINRQQLIDFYLNRRFRKSILCHKTHSLSHMPEPGKLPDLYLYGQFTRHDEFTEQYFSGASEARFTTSDNIHFSTTDPLLKRLMYVFATRSGKPASRQFFIDEISRMVPEPDRVRVPEIIDGNLIALIKRNIIKTSSVEAAYGRLKGDRPVASELARLQARQGGLVTNLRHQNVSLPDFERFLLDYLDGQNTLAEISERMVNGDLLRLPADHAGRQFVGLHKNRLLEICQNALLQFEKNALLK